VIDEREPGAAVIVDYLLLGLRLDKHIDRGCRRTAR